MAASRLSNTTRNLLRNVPFDFRSLITQIANGANPNVQFTFTEVKIVRGTLPHPPNSDRSEVRSSITIEFGGTAWGSIVAHLFSDGTIKTSAQMRAENDVRRQVDERLTEEEGRFPSLQQTIARRQAEASMMVRIQAIRVSQASTSEKQAEKARVEHEYRVFLRNQAQARVQAAANE